MEIERTTGEIRQNDRSHSSEDKQRAQDMVGSDIQRHQILQKSAQRSTQTVEHFLKMFKKYFLSSPKGRIFIFFSTWIHSYPTPPFSPVNEAGVLVFMRIFSETWVSKQKDLKKLHQTVQTIYLISGQRQ